MGILSLARNSCIKHTLLFLAPASDTVAGLHDRSLICPRLCIRILLCHLMYGRVLTKPWVGYPVAMPLVVAKLVTSSKRRWQWTRPCPYISQCFQNNCDTLVRIYMRLIYPVLYMFGEVTKAQPEAVRKWKLHRAQGWSAQGEGRGKGTNYDARHSKIKPGGRVMPLDF